MIKESTAFALNALNKFYHHKNKCQKKNRQKSVLPL